MAKIPYKEMDYANDRLAGTVLASEEKPDLLYIRDITRDRKVLCSSIRDPSGDMFACDIGSIRYEPFPLGYATINEEAYFVHRQSARQYKQGIRLNNLRALPGPLPIIRGENRGNLYKFLLQPCFNEYFGYNECLNMVEDIYRSVAVSRSCAVDEDGLFWYRGKRAGKINTDNGRIKLDERYNFIKEVVDTELPNRLL